MTVRISSVYRLKLSLSLNKETATNLILCLLKNVFNIRPIYRCTSLPINWFPCNFVFETNCEVSGFKWFQNHLENMMFHIAPCFVLFGSSICMANVAGRMRVAAPPVLKSEKNLKMQAVAR